MTLQLLEQGNDSGAVVPVSKNLSLTAFCHVHFTTMKETLTEQKRLRSFLPREWRTGGAFPKDSDLRTLHMHVGAAQSSGHPGGDGGKKAQQDFKACFSPEHGAAPCGHCPPAPTGSRCPLTERGHLVPAPNETLPATQPTGSGPHWEQNCVGSGLQNHRDGRPAASDRSHG